MSQLRNTQQHPNVEITVRNFGPIAEAASFLTRRTWCF